MSRLALIVVGFFLCGIATLSAFESRSVEVGVVEESPKGTEGGYAIPASGSSITCSVWRSDEVDPWPVSTAIKLNWSGSGLTSTMPSSASVRMRRNGGAWGAWNTRTSGWSYTPSQTGFYEFQVTADAYAGVHTESYTVCDAGNGKTGGSCYSVSGDVAFNDTYTCTESFTVFTPPPAPTNLSGSCSADGKTGTFSWSAPVGYNTFYTRVETLARVDVPSGFDNNFVGTSKSFTAEPGTHYVWWIHTKDTTNGAWSTAPTGGNFVCPIADLVSENLAIVGTTSTNITVTQGTSLTFTATGRNTGTASISDSFSDIFQYSTNGGSSWQTISTAGPHASLAVNGTVDDTSVTFQPATPDTYLIRHCVDEPGDAVSESDETNNCTDVANYVTITAVGGMGVSCAPNPATVAKNTIVTWHATATGGLPAYSYLWSGDASGIGTPHTEQYATAGSKTVYVTALDALGQSTGAIQCTVLSVAQECSDGLDNDGDGLIDQGSDPGCSTPTDDDETDVPPPPICSNGLDDDLDGKTDYPNDPGCSSPNDDDETNPVVLPQCSDGVDNADIEDTIADYPSDPGCTSAADDDETDPPAPACSNGGDDDGDLKRDYPLDPGCDSPTDNDETDPPTLPQCSDGSDNDGDTKTDYPNDPGCSSANDDDETDPPTLPQCSNGSDDTDPEDTLSDYPNDPGCSSAGDNDETDPPAPQVDLTIRNLTQGGSYADNIDPITLGDQVELKWVSSNAAYCEGESFTAQNGSGGSLFGEVEPSNEPNTPGNSITYGVRCWSGLQFDYDSTVVTLAGTPTLTINPSRVRSCDPGYFYPDSEGNPGCYVTGDGVDPNNLDGDGDPDTLMSFTDGQAYETDDVCGETSITLSCPLPYSGPDVIKVFRILPRLEER